MIPLTTTSAAAAVLQTSTYQAMVLLLFNDRGQWSFKEIQQQTEIPAPELKRALQGMMQGKSESVCRL